jgi:hypothetical protein
VFSATELACNPDNAIEKFPIVSLLVFLVTVLFVVARFDRANPAPSVLRAADRRCESV